MIQFMSRSFQGILSLLMNTDLIRMKKIMQLHHSKLNTFKVNYNIQHFYFVYLLDDCIGKLCVSEKKTRDKSRVKYVIGILQRKKQLFLKQFNICCTFLHTYTYYFLCSRFLMDLLKTHIQNVLTDTQLLSVSDSVAFSIKTSEFLTPHENLQYLCQCLTIT